MSYLPTGESVAWTLTSTAPCEFTATGRNSRGEDETLAIAIGAQGAGLFRATRSTQQGVQQPSTIGQLFPSQMHPVPELKGEWNMLQSGVLRAGDEAVFKHSFAQLSIQQGGAATMCEYGLFQEDSCKDGPSLTLQTNPEGGFDLKETRGSSAVRARLFAFRGPNGVLTLYGTTNLAGDESAAVQTSVVATPVRNLELPAEFSVTRYWEASSNWTGWTALNGSGSVKVIGVDPAAGTATRVTSNADWPASDGRIDVLRYNTPLPGIRFRPAGSFSSERLGQTVGFPDTFQFVLGSGAVVVVNAATGFHFYSVALPKPR